ncbi:hypothetical protein GDO81_006805 [Engystomops pustulosus]|uniref:Ig-like domain-containing protein n=1 Tax=Engystomops pustulosus TaxID=76066 RepID=A0AAV7D1G0_ENGPU|nr:hypothetical protein GDO81_006805 [Engystomops pustulosus]
MGVSASVFFFLSIICNIHAEITACPPVIPITLDVVAQLGSDILLPCSFTTNQLRQAVKNNSAVIWLKEVEYIVEISMTGQSSFWQSHHIRFQTFQSSAAKGNFSLFLTNLNRNDVGKYYCKLYNGVDCVVGHTVCKLDLDKSLWQNRTFLIGLASGCGGLLLLIIIPFAVYAVSKRRQNQRRNQSTPQPNPYDTSSAKEEYEVYANDIYHWDH